MGVGVEVDGVKAAKPSNHPITLCAARFVQSRMCLKIDQKSWPDIERQVCGLVFFVWHAVARARCQC